MNTRLIASTASLWCVLLGPAIGPWSSFVAQAEEAAIPAAATATVAAAETSPEAAISANAPTALAPGQKGLPLYRQIDALIEARLTTPQAGLSSDAEFVRRIYLDLICRVPSGDETRQFLDDPSSYKRVLLIEDLLARPEFARRLQYFFDVSLMERRPDKHIPRADWQAYLYQSFLNKKPFNELAAEILGADGTGTRPAAKFYLDRDGDPNALTRDVGRLFLGMDMQCAQCHDHPNVNDYEQAEYYGLQAFFNRSFVFTGADKLPVFAETGVGEVTYQSVFFKEVPPQTLTPRLPERDGLAEPAFAAGSEYVVAPADGVRPIPKYSRRASLAEQIRTDAGKDIAKNAANRVWSMLLGRGLVHPPDMQHDDNPPTHPELLAQLTDAFVASGYDVTELVRQIVLSDTYQRSSELPPGVNEADVPPEQYGVAIMKPLGSEQLAWSVLEVSGYVEGHRGTLQSQVDADPRLAQMLSLTDNLRKRRDELVETRLFDTYKGYIDTFAALYAAAPGQPDSTDFQATVQQALFVANGSAIQLWLGPDNGFTSRLAAIPEDDRLAEELYLNVLARRPTAEEKQLLKDYLAARGPQSKKAAMSELVWALLASTEFRFNH